MSATPLRIVFAGTPEFAAAHLQALLDSHHQVIAVYTQPDRPAGRGKKLAASPVKQLAEQHKLPIYQPLHFKEENSQAALAALLPDIMVVVAYGLLLPQSVLNIPRLGCINVHASLLPRWRGAAPIQRTIEMGDTETGICIMQMEAGLDTGPVLHRQSCPISPQDTGGSLHDKLMALGPPALLTTLDKMATGDVTAHPQDDQYATYAHKLTKQDAQLDFRNTADVLSRKIRAFDPFPVCWCVMPDGERLRIWSAAALPEMSDLAAGTVLACDAQGLKIACTQGSLLLTALQLPNRNKMHIRDIVNGNLLTLKPGDQLL